MRQIHSILIVLCAILNIAGSLKLKQINRLYYKSYYECAPSMSECYGLIYRYHYTEEPDNYYCDKTTFTIHGSSRTQYCLRKKPST